jgi:hypothetical protein
MPDGAGRSSKKSTPKSEPAKRCLGDSKKLFKAMSAFIDDHSVVESTQAIEGVTKEMCQSNGINAAALVPLRHNIISFESALKWGFLLHKIVPRVQGEDGGAPPCEFDLKLFHAEVSTIYDRAMLNEIWVYIEDDEDDEDDSSDSD